MQNGVLTFQMLSVKAGLLKDILSGFKFILKLEAFKHKHFGTNVPVHRQPGSFKAVAGLAWDERFTGHQVENSDVSANKHVSILCLIRRNMGCTDHWLHQHIPSIMEKFSTHMSKICEKSRISVCSQGYLLVQVDLMQLKVIAWTVSSQSPALNHLWLIEQKEEYITQQN